MSRIILITGGARSGKSRTAQAWARSYSDSPVYLATSRRWDDDHAARIARHRADRGPEWTTVEEELRPSLVGGKSRVIVVDCVTLWLTNLFTDLRQELDPVLAWACEEIERTSTTNDTWIWVTNELGQGLHAPDECGRRFVDLQGFVNQYLASKADLVALLVAGIAVPIKGKLPL